MVHRLLACVAVLMLWGATQVGALAASGTAVGVDQGAGAERNKTVEVLHVGADLNIGDRVITDAGGQVEVVFDDNTKLVVGPSSALLIEDYLLRNDGSAGKLAINALAGTFRFITGDAAKDKYLIKTPTGTIGVRGTEFDFIVDEEGTHVVVFHGSVIMCNTKSVCITLDGSCQIGEYDLTDATLLGDAQDTSGSEREDLRGMFPYAQDQSSLSTAFWVDSARQCFNKPVSPPDPGYLDTDNNFGEPPPDYCTESCGY